MFKFFSQVSWVFTCFIFLAGCSSWELKERCEQTNWFEYSRDVALSGRYLDEDHFIKECKGVDRLSATQTDQGFKNGRERYCIYESFFRNGEAGEPVNFKMCDNLILYKMQEQYAHGLTSFCKADSGYNYGSSGKVYKGVCIKRDEEKFLPSYYKGRGEFLVRSIAQLEKEIMSFQRVQDQVQTEIARFNGEILSIPSGLKECSSQIIYNPATQKNEAELICSEPPYIQSLRSNLYSQMNEMRDQFTKNASILRNMMEHLSQYRSELTKIPLTQLASVSSTK